MPQRKKNTDLEKKHRYCGNIYLIYAVKGNMQSTLGSWDDSKHIPFKPDCLEQKKTRTNYSNT